MALQLDPESLGCSVCLDLLKDPVTLPCGHSYCMSCVGRRWDEEDPHHMCSCPLCKQTFTPRPAVVTNVMLADLVEELKKKKKLQEAPADSVKPGEIVCDVCAARARKAFKSCLVCRVSYCELHLQPHFQSPAFEKHKLVEPSRNLQERFCSRHDEVMKIFCRTDQQAICFFCSLDEHKDHDTVSAAAHRKDKSRELELYLQNIRQRIQDREKDVKLLQQEEEAISRSADRAVRDSEESFSGFVCLIDRRISDVKERIRSQQEEEISRVKELEEKLQLELSELKLKDAELQQLLHSDDHIQLLLDSSLLSLVTESTSVLSVCVKPLRHFEDVTAAVSNTRDKLQDVLHEEWPTVLRKVIEVDVLLPRPEPRSRKEFFQYSRQITLDPNTVNTWLQLSDGNRRATVTRGKQTYSSHPERFTDWLQVLSREGLTGCCYWEVERSSGVSVAVAYKDSSRSGQDSGFGNNDRSWSLGCFDLSFHFRHKNVKTLLSGPASCRIGVYLDHTAGTLSFYSVSDTMTLLHRVQTTFTQPLHAGLSVYWVGDTAELCELK
ncbi:tripartite motif-containing protein 16-like [Labrus mixtus]|uniref:tripartite motif-containing protein 16-like n=1 Tax=Labrus mixtus TaxID=508554 RepID=UPI0029BFC670|nr:tripartite motif-containing protein 16-like [Labrus mixtus]